MLQLKVEETTFVAVENYFIHVADTFAEKLEVKWSAHGGRLLHVDGFVDVNLNGTIKAEGISNELLFIKFTENWFNARP